MSPLNPGAGAGLRPSSRAGMTSEWLVGAEALSAWVGSAAGASVSASHSSVSGKVNIYGGPYKQLDTHSRVSSITTSV